MGGAKWRKRREVSGGVAVGVVVAHLVEGLDGVGGGRPLIQPAGLRDFVARVVRPELQAAGLGAADVRTFVPASLWLLLLRIRIHVTYMVLVRPQN